MIIVDSYKFPRWNAILRESTNTKEHDSRTLIQVSIALTDIFEILKY